ncbi:MAG: hypothetical protein IOD12_08485 [Silvanigrellales bacterium]|nr:hypothetical protein [Silvanigrellales bacterium]
MGDENKMTKTLRKKKKQAFLFAWLVFPFSSCSPRKEDLTRYASTFAQSWQGRSLRLQGVPKTSCVQFSTSPGSCVVFRRNDDKTIEKHTGTCEVEGSVTGKYVSLNCTRGDGKSKDAPCVPGDNKIVINLNAALKLEGTEAEIVDSSLARSIVPIGSSCEPEATGTQGTPTPGL